MTRGFRERSGGVRDGVKIVAAPGVRKSVWLVAGAMALVALAVLLVSRVAGDSVEPIGAAPAPPPRAATAAPVAPTRENEASNPAASRHARRIARPEAEAPPEAQDSATPAVAPSHDDVPFRLGKPGVKSGIDLFPSMGTKPTKVGIVVPDDFELPEGYVRHFQANADGQLLPPILLFHPDYEWVDDAGKPIPLSPDRVVPPELAPPGMPIQVLEVPPEQREPGAAR